MNFFKYYYFKHSSANLYPEEWYFSTLLRLITRLFTPKSTTLYIFNNSFKLTCSFTTNKRCLKSFEVPELIISTIIKQTFFLFFSSRGKVRLIHRKKAFRYSRPQPGCHLPNSPWAGIINIWRHNSRPRESLVSDIPAGDGNIKKLVFTV